MANLVADVVASVKYHL